MVVHLVKLLIANINVTRGSTLCHVSEATEAPEERLLLHVFPPPVHLRERCKIDSREREWNIRMERLIVCVIEREADMLVKRKTFQSPTTHSCVMSVFESANVSPPKKYLFSLNFKKKERRRLILFFIFDLSLLSAVTSVRVAADQLHSDLSPFFFTPHHREMQGKKKSFRFRRSRQNVSLLIS